MSLPLPPLELPKWRSPTHDCPWCDGKVEAGASSVDGICNKCGYYWTLEKTQKPTCLHCTRELGAHYHDYDVCDECATKHHLETPHKACNKGSPKNKIQYRTCPGCSNCWKANEFAARLDQIRKDYQTRFQQWNVVARWNRRLLTKIRDDVGGFVLLSLFFAVVASGSGIGYFWYFFAGVETHSYTINNLLAHQTDEQRFEFKKDARVRITVISTVTHPATDIDLFVVRLTDNKILALDERLIKDCEVDFIVPETDTYRVIVRNVTDPRLRGIATACKVTITQR